MFVVHYRTLDTTDFGYRVLYTNKTMARQCDFCKLSFLRLDRTWCIDSVACRRSAIYPSVKEKLYVHGIHDIQESESSHHSFKDFSTSDNCTSFPLSLGRLKIARAEILQGTCREPHAGVGVWAIDDRLREARHE